jgi:hypothetical protein
MPYRPLLWTLATVALTLLAVGIWITKVSPLVAGAREAAETAATQRVEPRVAVGTHPATTRAAVPTPDQGARRLVQGTFVLSFVLVCLLLIVGLAATFREWVRFHTVGRPPQKKPSKTQYVDAWKIAGERMKSDEENPDK